MFAPLPRIVFVLGKGGVGRSTISAALGSALASSGARVLVLEWTVAEAIAPWFGLPPAGVTPVEIEPRLAVANYQLGWALRTYFVDHLRLARFHRHVIEGPHVRRLIEAAPGLSELMFLGQLWWLTTLAADEAGLRFDHIVVDAPATGHGSSILRFPATVATLGATGLLAQETGRVREMMADSAWTGALIVSHPEELAIDETRELLPRATEDLGRPPLAAIVNRSVARLGVGEEQEPELEAIARRLSPGARQSFDNVLAELRARVRHEHELRAALEGRTEHGTVGLDDVLLDGVASPREIVGAIAQRLGAST